MEDEERRNETEWRATVAMRARFVAELDGQVVGVAAGGPSTDSAAAVLTTLWVDPMARGRGIGDVLVQTVVGWSRDAGFGRLVLWVTDGNVHAERLYERNGFTRTGEVISERQVEFEMSRDL